MTHLLRPKLKKKQNKTDQMKVFRFAPVRYFGKCKQFGSLFYINIGHLYTLCPIV